MRLLFAGSPDVAVPTLRALVDSEHDLVAVVSQPDRPTGRRRVPTPTAVSRFAREHSLTLHTPHSSAELHDVTKKAAPDLAIAVAYGRLIPPEVLALPSHGWWNVHFSLLPRWRGATPVPHALLAGDEMTGVSVFQMDEGLDTGEILAQAPHPIEPEDTSATLLEKLSHLGARLLGEAITRLENGTLSPQAQSGQSTDAPKLGRLEGRLHWNKPSREIYNRFRAVTPEPGAFTMVRGRTEPLGVREMAPAPGETVLSPGQVAVEAGNVFVGTADGALWLKTVHPAGKRAMAAIDWWRGAGEDVWCEV